MVTRHLQEDTAGINFIIRIGKTCNILRAPKTCTCGDVDHIDIVEYLEMTEDLYEENYARTNRPVIIRNVSSEWAAMGTVDFGWLRDRYLASEDILKYEAPNCFFKCYKTNEFKSLGDLFR